MVWDKTEQKNEEGLEKNARFSVPPLSPAPHARRSLDKKMDDVFGKVDNYYIEINNRLDSANRNEIAVYHVYGADGLIKGDGLPVFWDSLGKEYHDYLASYDIIGLKELGGIILSSIWVKNVINRGITDGGYYKFTEDEEKELTIIEGRYYKASEKIISTLWAFISTIE